MSHLLAKASRAYTQLLLALLLLQNVLPYVTFESLQHL